jgi:hypothetical protein
MTSNGNAPERYFWELRIQPILMESSSPVLPDDYCVAAHVEGLLRKEFEVQAEAVDHKPRQHRCRRYTVKIEFEARFLPGHHLGIWISSGRQGEVNTWNAWFAVVTKWKAPECLFPLKRGGADN